jgi:hypothetical protein
MAATADPSASPSPPRPWCCACSRRSPGRDTGTCWARFNKDQNLAQLERSITPELKARSQNPAVRKLALEAGRKTVAEFVTTWLLKEQGWKRDPEHRVVVLFPGEDMPRKGASPD